MPTVSYDSHCTWETILHNRLDGNMGKYCWSTHIFQLLMIWSKKTIPHLHDKYWESNSQNEQAYIHICKYISSSACIYRYISYRLESIPPVHHYLYVACSCWEDIDILFLLFSVGRYFDWLKSIQFTFTKVTCTSKIVINVCCNIIMSVHWPYFLLRCR